MAEQPGQSWDTGDPSRIAKASYDGLAGLISGFCKVWFRMEVHGRENVPPTGPCIIAPVHRSYIDTPLVSAVTRRRIRYMGKESMWKNRPSAWFFTAMGGFPVQRGTADRDAIRRCERVLELGQPLVMFPEGTRRAGPVVEEFHSGPAFVAARTGAPIVPVGIGGSAEAMGRDARFVRPAKIVIVIGEPIHPPPRVDGKRVPRRIVSELSAALRHDIQGLYDEAQRLAGHA